MPLLDKHNLEVSVEQLRRLPVFGLKCGDFLAKGGRQKNPYVFACCAEVKQPFLCYYWMTGGQIKYVGSVTSNYKNAPTNLLGRIGNYLQNHSGETNKNIFDKANEALRSADLEFGIFTFDAININGLRFSYCDASADGKLILMMESLLITSHKLHGECPWNK